MLIRVFFGFIFYARSLVENPIHISLASFLWDIAPDATPQNAASHLGLFCLLRENSLKKLIKI